MKNSSSKKIDLRARFLKYAQTHARNDRLPTVREMRQALGVTNYMLMNCMNELTREGIIYCPSRKEGTFFTSHHKKYSVGLFMDNAGVYGGIGLPAWVSGFFQAFSYCDDFFVRMIPFSRKINLENVFRQYGLDAAVFYPGTEQNMHKYLSEIPGELKKRIITSVPKVITTQSLPEGNTICTDLDHWVREFVRSAIVHECRNFLFFSPPGIVCDILLDEIRKNDLPFHEECHIQSVEILQEKLPSLIRKYKINAVFCKGGMYHQFASVIKGIPSFRPYMPLFGSENMYKLMKEEYPWMNASFIFEHLSDFYRRQGETAGKALMELARTGEGFPTIKLRMKHSEEYRALCKRKGIQL